MSQENTQVYHVVAYEFAGRKRADEVVDLIRKSSRANEYKVQAWAIMEVDDNGKPHVHQSGHGGMGTAIGAGTGALLGLVGGPAGLIIWTLGGALIGGLAGKFMGHQFDKDALKALTVDMGPNTSAIIVVVEDTLAEGMDGDLKGYGAKVVTVTLGSQLSGEVASYAAVSVGENAEKDEAESPAAPEAAAKSA